jgi:hypothetical protein
MKTLSSFLRCPILYEKFGIPQSKAFFSVYVRPNTYSGCNRCADPHLTNDFAVSWFDGVDKLMDG